MQRFAQELIRCQNKGAEKMEKIKLNNNTEKHSFLGMFFYFESAILYG